MEAIMRENLPIFARSRDEFKSTLSPVDKANFELTTLEDLQRTILDIQRQHASARKNRNMNRLNSFLEAMEQYSKLVETFLNTSDFVAFIWGPMKFLLQTASNFAEAFDELLAMYQDIGEALPMLGQYEKLFEEKEHMGVVLGHIYKDICKFHQQACAYFRKPIWRQLFHAFWKTFRTQFNPMVEDFRRHKRLIETQASLYQFEEIRCQRATAEEEFRHLREAEDLRRWREVIDWLAAADMGEIQEARASDRADYPEVCQWILQDDVFKKWSDHNSRASPMMWVNGIPGAGKSTLASFVVEQCQVDPPTPVLLFYCRHGDPARSSLIGLIRSIIAQTLAYDQDLLSYVYEKSARCGETVLKTRSLAEEISSNIIQGLGKSFLILDGLDECPPGEKRSIWKWLQPLCSSEPEDRSKQIRCAIFSQRDHDAQKLFKGLPSICLEEAHLEKDIRTLCEIEGVRIKHKFGLSSSATEDIVHQVSTEARGMFLYAKLVTKNLLAQTRRSNLERELQPGRFPKGLDQAYGRIVERVFDPDSPESEDARQLLGLVVCAKRPLKWTEIQGAVSIDLTSSSVDYDGRRLLVDSKDLCGSLVEKMPRGTIDLVHATAKQFLDDQQYIRLKTEEFNMSRLCLQYLSFPCFGSSHSSHQIQDFILSGHYLFAEYAIAFWPEHLLEALKTVDGPHLAQLASWIDRFLQERLSPNFKSDLHSYGKKHELPELQPFPFHRTLGKVIAFHMKQKSGKQQVSAVKPLNIFDRLAGIRSRIEHMASSGATPSLQDTCGPDLFKCARLHCRSFHQGFSTLAERERHEEKHIRSFRCSFEGCPATSFGFTSAALRDTHIDTVHRRYDSNGQFPIPTKLWELSVEDALDKLDLTQLREYLRLDRESHQLAQMYRTIWNSLVKLEMDPRHEVVLGELKNLQKKVGSSEHIDDFPEDWHWTSIPILQPAVEAENIAAIRRLARDGLYWIGYCHHEFRISSETSKFRAALLAIQHDDCEILRCLCGSMAKITDHDTRILCSEACYHGSLCCLKWMVADPGLEIPSRRDGTYTYTTMGRLSCDGLLCAIAEGHVQVVEWILEVEEHREEASFMEPSYTWRCLLDTAVVNRQPTVFSSLIKNKSISQHICEYDLSNYRAGLRLISLAYAGRPHDDGPDFNHATIPDLPDRYGCTPLMYAAYHGMADIVDKVLSSLSAMILMDHTGLCPLGMEEIPIDAPPLSDREEHSALLLATLRGHKDIVRTLIQRGARVSLLHVIDLNNRSDVQCLDTLKPSRHVNMIELAYVLERDEICECLDSAFRAQENSPYQIPADIWALRPKPTRNATSHLSGPPHLLARPGTTRHLPKPAYMVPIPAWKGF